MKAPQSIFMGDVRSARRRPMRLLWNWLLLALGVLLSQHFFSGISVQGAGHLGENGWGTLVLTVLMISLLNLFLKPLLVLFTLPFVVLTWGLGLWVINAAVLYVASWVVPGFEIDTFFTALWAALVISAVSLVINLLFGPRRQASKPMVMIGIDRNTFMSRTRNSRYDQD